LTITCTRDLEPGECVLEAITASTVTVDNRCNLSAVAARVPQDSMTEVSFTTADYIAWLAGLKSRVEQARQRAALSVNRELVSLYWQIGNEILVRQRRQGWGAKVVDQLARDLRAAFPDMRGFSPRNLKYMRTLAEA
jgi:hypothetical protein